MYKCIECGKLSKDEIFDCCDSPAVRKCTVTHLLSPDGQGAVVARAKRVLREKGEESLVKQELRIMCGATNDTLQVPVATPHYAAVTCLDCLALAPKRDPN